MAITAIGRAALSGREAVKTRAYRDSVGVWTIGVGHTSAAGPPKVVPGLTITREEALDIFARDLVQYEAAVDKAVTVTLADHERDALVSICYNIGAGGFRRAAFVKRLNAGDRAGCAAAIMQWTKPKEITTRRQAERDQFLTPYDVRLPKARSNDARPVSLDAPAPRAAPVRKPAAPAPAPVASIAPVPAPAGEPTPALPVPKVTVAGYLWDRLRGRTPLPPVTLPPAAATQDNPILAAQTRLKALGYTEVGWLDGTFGNRTRAAVLAFQADNGLPATGTVDDALLAALAKGRTRIMEPQRVAATKADLREAVPEVAKHLDGIGLIGKLILGASGVGAADASGALDGIKGAADQATATLTSVRAVADGAIGAVQWVVAHWWIVAAVVGLYVLAKGGMAALRLVVLLRQGRLL